MGLNHCASKFPSNTTESHYYVILIFEGDRALKSICVFLHVANVSEPYKDIIEIVNIRQKLSKLLIATLIFQNWNKGA